ncbi:hypothetical protein L9F63_025237 [Diploptera punctata]|uniref:Ionotropic glutamate receptor C-terminal domain-containing protein n=1 Tax=Diploptera punctata TaxID=6984 RepID=A0AAD8E5V0_DIPPU|nr:hypothetical protein L9F63_025237 [Diploptera punctata]
MPKFILERKFFQEIGIILGIEFNVIKSHHTAYDAGFTQYLQKQNLEISSAPKEEAISKTYTHVSMFSSYKYVWFVPKSKSFARWSSFTRVFNTTTWISILFFLIFAGVALKFFSVIIHCIENKSETHKEMSYSLLISWSIILGVSVPEMPSNIHLQILFISIVIWCLAINTVFQSFVTIYFFDPGYHHQINTIEEIVNSNLTKILDTFFLHYYIRNYQENLNSTNMLGYSSEMLELINQCNNVGIFANLEEMLLYFKTHNPQLRFKYHILKDNALYSSPIIRIRNHAPFRHIISDTIIRAIESGIPEKLKREQTLINNIIDTDNSDKFIPMEVLHLQSAFFLLFLGLGFSITTFIVELSIHHFQRRYSKV